MVKITPEWLARSGTEDGEQSALFCYAQDMSKKDARWELLYAIPNGGKRGVATAARLAATGVKRGFPDIGITYAAVGPDTLFYNGMFLELKRRGTTHTKAGKLNDAQAYWRDTLRSQGYYVQVAFGWEQAVEMITEYFDGKFR